MSKNNFEIKVGLAEMLKGGVIMDVTNVDQAKIAEDSGACAVMALERIPSDIRSDGGIARMSDPEMILGIQLYRQESAETASIVPIAFPLIAGAGTLTSLLALRAEFAVANIIVAIVVNILVVYVVLKSSKRIESFLGNSGITVIRKVFGVILLAIAVKLFTSNVQELF